MKFTAEEYARQHDAKRIHELEQRVEELEAERTLIFTEIPPVEIGWYWFIPNGKSPMLGTAASIRQVENWPLHKTPRLCVRFPQWTFLVIEMGGMWSERLEEPEEGEA